MSREWLLLAWLLSLRATAAAGPSAICAECHVSAAADRQYYTAAAQAGDLSRWADVRRRVCLMMRGLSCLMVYINAR